MPREPLVSIPSNISPADILELSPANAVKFMPKPLRKEVLELKARVGRVVNDQIACAHELGRIASAAVGSRAPYAEKSVFWLAAALGVSTTYVYRAIAFYEAFPDLAAVQKYVERGAAANYDLTLTHFQELVKQKNSHARTRLVETSLDGQLSTRALRVAVADSAGRRRELEGGPALAYAVKVAHAGTRRLAKAIDPRVAGGVCATLGALEAGRVNAGLLDEVESLAAGMEELSRQLAEYAAEIECQSARLRPAGGDGPDAGGDAETEDPGHGESDEAADPGVRDEYLETGDWGGSDEPKEADDPGEADEPEMPAPPEPPEPPARRKPGRPRKIAID